MARLSATEIEAFFEQGFVKIPRLFDSAEVESLRDAFDELYARAQKLRITQTHEGAFYVLAEKPQTVSVLRVVWCAAADPRLERVGRDPRILGLASQLLGSRAMDQLISQAHFKMPGDGVSFDWHQDVQHRERRPGDWKDLNGRGSYVQTLLCLDDMTETNGPLLVVPGSAGKGRVSSKAYSYDEPMKGPQTPEGALSVTAQAGDLVLLHPYTLHGSRPNESNRARRLFVNGYAYPGANARLYPGLGAGRRLEI